MHRNRIRVRPAGSSRLSSGTSSMAHMGFDGADVPFCDLRAAAPRQAESPFVAPNNQAWSAPSQSSLYDANELGEGWRYVRRIANLAYNTISGVLGVLHVKPHGEVNAPRDNNTSAKAFPHQTVHPNTPHISAATPAQSYSGAPQPSEETHVADTIELRRPRRSTAQYHVPPQQPPVSEPALQTRDAPLTYPSAREAPQCQITVNQYFAAPERSIYPMVFAHPDEATTYRGAPAYPSRASLLTAPSSLQVHAKRPRLASPPAAAAESRMRKAPKTATDNDACDASLSNAPSAIPLGSQENSLTVPIGSLATVRLFGKAKAFSNDDASVAAKPAAPLADMPTAKAPLFGGTATPAAAAAAPNLFVFGSKPAETIPARSAPAAPAFGAPKTNSFVKAGPPAVIPDDGAFAPNADSDDDDKGNDKKAKTESATPGGSSGAFSFDLNSNRAKPTFGSGFAFGGSSSLGASTGASGTAANPFSFPNLSKPIGSFGASCSPSFSFSTSKK